MAAVQCQQTHAAVASGSSDSDDESLEGLQRELEDCKNDVVPSVALRKKWQTSCLMASNCVITQKVLRITYVKLSYIPYSDGTSTLDLASIPDSGMLHAVLPTGHPFASSPTPACSTPCRQRLHADPNAGHCTWVLGHLSMFIHLLRLSTTLMIGERVSSAGYH